MQHIEMPELKLEVEYFNKNDYTCYGELLYININSILSLYIMLIISNIYCIMTKPYKVIILMIIFLSACSTLKNENVTYKLDSQLLLSKKVEMQLPMPFHIQKDNYEEGVVYFYSFVDSAIIIILQGSMVELPIDKYKPQKSKIRNHRKISVGCENNKFWRKDVYKGVNIYYDNVSSSNKRVYDKILNEIKITSY